MLKIKIVLMNVIYFCSFSVCWGQDSIDQFVELLTASEGDAVVLNCKYHTTDQSPYFFWYKQKSHKPPQFIVMNLTFGLGYTDLEFKERFSANLDLNSSLIPLRIQEVRVQDTAVYYCALSSTVLTAAALLLQKPHQQ
uniref:Ig-like domain-containing protein n=1 Tax=Astyanax mexicanus TaxID=7994 RepID=A0A8B9LJN5_ASTMX